MSEPTVDAMMTDLVDTLKGQLPDLNDRILYGPPEQLPPALMIWTTYGPVDVEWGNLEVCDHAITIVCATPRKANYPKEYAAVTALAQRARWAVRTNVVLADAGVITGVGMGAATGMSFGGLQDALVVATVNLIVTTKTDITNIVQE